MNFTVDSKAFASALSRASEFSSKSLFDTSVFAQAKLTAEGSRVRIETDNTNTHFCVSLAAKVGEGGSFCVNCQRIASLFAAMPQSDAKVSCENGKMSVVVGKTKTSMRASATDKFPPSRSQNFANPAFSASFGKGEFANVVAKTAFAAARDADAYHNPLFSRILLKFAADGSLFAFSTDSRCLSFLPIQTEWQAEREESDEGFLLSIPPKHAAAILKGDGERVSVSTSEKSESETLIQCGDTEIVFLQLDQSPPSVEKIVGKEYPISATFQRQDALDALKHVAPLASDDDGAKLVTVSIAEGGITFSSKTSGEGESSETVPCDLSPGDACAAFSCRLDWLRCPLAASRDLPTLKLFPDKPQTSLFCGGGGEEFVFMRPTA